MSSRIHGYESDIVDSFTAPLARVQELPRVVTCVTRMRLPVVPFVIAATLLAAVWYLFNATRSGERTLDAPHLTRLADFPGVETEVAISPDGKRLAAIVGGNLWV